MKVVIPMAGRGSRFLSFYNKPKPIIDVLGKPMVWWALRPLAFIDPKDMIFICLEAHEDDFKISNVLKNTFGNLINIVLIPAVTRGAVETVLFAREYIDSDCELIVSDSDHYFNGVAFYDEVRNRQSDIAGIIPVFKPKKNDSKWSYTLFDLKGMALDIKEKDISLARKGAFANIGAYYFAKGNIFIKEAEAMIRENDMYGTKDKKEFYVAPIYRRLLKKGFKIKTAVVDNVWGLGTPQDLENFLGIVGTNGIRLKSDNLF